MAVQTGRVLCGTVRDKSECIGKETIFGIVTDCKRKHPEKSLGK